MTGGGGDDAGEEEDTLALRMTTDSYIIPLSFPANHLTTRIAGNELLGTIVLVHKMRPKGSLLSDLVTGQLQCQRGQKHITEQRTQNTCTVLKSKRTLNFPNDLQLPLKAVLVHKLDEMGTKYESFQLRRFKATNPICLDLGFLVSFKF